MPAKMNANGVGICILPICAASKLYRTLCPHCFKCRDHCVNLPECKRWGARPCSVGGVPIGCTLLPNAWKAVTELARREKKSVSQLVRELVDKRLEETGILREMFGYESIKP